MRCFEWQRGQLLPGIEVDGDNGLLLGNGHVRVPLHNQNPARVRQGRVFHVYPFWVNPYEGEPFLTLAHPHEKHENDATILVRISTENPAPRTSEGTWYGTTNDVKTLISAPSSNKDQSWTEGLVSIPDKRVVRIRPEGADDMWAITNSMPSPHTETWIRHETRLLLVEEGLL